MLSAVFDIFRDPEFDHVYLDTDINGLNKLGFKFGDAVNLKFSNGKSLLNVPYYNNFYSRTGLPLLVSYKNFLHPLVTINNKRGPWTQYKFKKGDKVYVEIYKVGGYKAVYEAMCLHLSNKRKAFQSNKSFCNFRSINGGKIKPNRAFRSASPCNNMHYRAKYVDDLVYENDIKYIINLSDSEKKIKSLIKLDNFNSLHWKKIYDDKKVLCLSLAIDMWDLEAKQKVVYALKESLKQPLPFLIHCTEGKDRTGFVCLIIEALCGATYNELIDDYMESYKNYYNLSKTKDSKKYNLIKNFTIDELLENLTNSSNETAMYNMRFDSFARQYLKDGGMDDSDINKLIDRLTC